MNSLSVIVLIFSLAACHAGLIHQAPVYYAAAPAYHPAHVVGPLNVPHPIHYAAPAKVVYSPAVYAAAPIVPVVKHVFAAPVVKHVSYASYHHGHFF